MNHDTDVDSFEHAGFRVRILLDPDPPNPREEWDNYSTLACIHRRYRLGDVQLSTPETEDEIRERLTNEGEEVLALLPLYLYDHSGIRMSVDAFADPFDSGRVGWGYVTRRQALAGGFEDQSVESMERVLRQDVETYSQFLEGRVYGYVIETIEGGDVVTSCWGYYGDPDLDDMRAAAKDAAEHTPHPNRSPSREDASCSP